MSSPKPLPPVAAVPVTAVPPLPPGHPLQQRLAAWVELRDQLADLNAKLEYMRLMMRLAQR
ncbi:MAG: hypothetical protein IT501_03915 [Rubrivivax sp.]|nr:hypothetical protein [Rubrivivax sp.]